MAILGALAIAILLAVSYADRYVPAISDWYLDMAAPQAVKASSRLVASDEDAAYLACVRHAVKAGRANGRERVLTFEPADESQTMRLGADRYVIRANFDETFENGVTAESVFCCRVHLVNEAWKVESLKVRRTASEGEIPAGA